MSTILITGKLHPKAIESFKNYTKVETIYKPDCQRAELLELLPQVNVLITRSETTVDREIIDAGQHLKVIARAAVGVANIDVEYATGKGILVINCPGKNTNSAAELTLGLLLNLVRHVPEAMQTVKSGGWDRHRFTGNELREKRLGIVGIGNVGHRVARFAQGFEMEVFAYDPYVAPQVFAKYGVRQVSSLEEMAGMVDILTVHIPKNSETTGLVDATVLESMPKGSLIVNAARGGIINEQDLLKALECGHIRGAAIDTWENEPHPMTALVEHEAVVCSPHIGASTVEAQLAIGKTTFEQVIKSLDGGVVDYPVNLPKVGVIDNPLVKTYAVLAEKLGSVAGQIINFNPQSVELLYRGELAALDQSLIKLGWMKGFANHVVDGYVSFVNAEHHFAKLGIHVTENIDEVFTAYRSALKAIIRGQDGEELRIGGVVFDQKLHRWTLLNDFYFEVDPSGTLLIIENLDRPGVIGDVGTFLGRHKINVDSFELSRTKKGGTAVAIVKTDTALTAEQLKKCNEINNIKTVKSIKL